ncbi:MAG TPA: PSD1 and planctomycete cytochrome C domain-containing protein [Humisphaera sp.]|nr:PSD1 and planctomycete cytochrome C domain-containing protein [Humisphaera sp.]
MSQRRRISIGLTGLCALLGIALIRIAASAGVSADAPARLVDFERDVQPIFKSACYECHGSGRQKSKLRLDSRPLAMTGGRLGKDIIAGDSAHSPLFVRVSDPDAAHRMPQDRDALSAAQIETIRLWIDQGAAWPDSAANQDAKIDRHWAFVPPTRPQVPEVADQGWARNPIDQFIFARLAAQGLSPAPKASKEALIRRVYLDVIGIPPSPAQVDAFVKDESPDAFEKVVDQLLADPGYGQRWARHWLDLARYAESEGFKADEARPNIWRYRDYVIDSLNADKPYDRFIREQIAGDELWPDDPAAVVATAFNRHYPDESNARNLMQRRQEILNDITDTVGSVFLGLTVECARCHNHKYDDIPQADYYRLQAFFSNIRAADSIVLAPADKIADYQQKEEAWEQKTKEIRDEMARLEEPARKSIIKEYVDKYPTEIQEILVKAPTQRSAMDWQMYYKASLYLDPGSPQYIAPSATCAAKLKGEAKTRYDDLKAQLASYASLKPAELPKASAIQDVSADAPPTHVLRTGVYDSYLQEVQPGFLSALTSEKPQITPPTNVISTGRRTALANWLASPQNPVTARLMVNRIWQHHFGDGIVRTASDFGVQGELPSQPQLLDWLSTEFVNHGWSMKHIHRLILTSATYQQATGSDEKALRVDPENRLLSHFPRKRLEGEVIRDAALAVSGLLNPKMGGPSVLPDLPAGMDGHGGWKMTGDPSARNRRSIYVYVKRNLRYPMFEAFDMPDTVETCARRYNTITPAQALTMLNGNITLQWAQGFAARVLKQSTDDAPKQIEFAYRCALGRRPTVDELQMAREFLKQDAATIAGREGTEEPIALPPGRPQSVSMSDAAALVDFCHVLLNSNEFVYGS